MADKKNDSGSESESTDEPVVGNLNKFAVVPPGYTGRPQKGHLTFDACFESGNLGRVDYITDYEYDLFIRPDTCNPRFRVWFNFTVENVLADQRVIFNIVNFSKTKSLYREGMSPMVKSSSRRKWVRLPPKLVYYYKCPEHRKNYVLSFAFSFDRESDVYQFAYCYPYSYTRLQNCLDQIERRNLPHVQRELLCLSVQQRRLDMLVITNRDGGKRREGKRTVFVTARVHPGETPASFVCQGVIDFLVSNHPIAKTLRDFLIFKIVPMLNPDGVYLGNYRSSLMGFDLNRHWLEPSPWAHPTLYATKSLLVEMDEDQSVDLDFFIDIHAHSTLMNGFMYGNTYDDAGRFERQTLFPKLLCSNADDFSLINTSFNRDTVKAGTGRRTLGGCLDENSFAYTLEVSFFSYMTNSNPTQLAAAGAGGAANGTFAQPYTEEGYMKLGRNVARTFLDYYKAIGYISEKPSSGLTLKQGRRSAKERKSRDVATRAVSEPLRPSGDERYDRLLREGRLTCDRTTVVASVDALKQGDAKR